MSVAPWRAQTQHFWGRQRWAVQHLFSGRQLPPFMIEASFVSRQHM